MALLLTQRDLQPLFEDPELFEGAFKVIEVATLAQQRGGGGQAGFLRLDMAVPDQTFSLYSTSHAPGFSVRVFPSIGSVQGSADAHVMLLFDRTTGSLQALLSGDDLNTLRTAIPAGVGARYLQPDDAKVLCILGSGYQARGHFLTFHHALPALERVQVWSPTPANRERFAREMSARYGLPVEAMPSARAACAGADVITATGAGAGPAVEADWVRPGALMVTMTRAAPAALLARARVYAPSRQRPVPLAMRPGGPPRPGTIGEPAGPAPAELADVILGKRPARERDDETIVFELAAMYAWDAPLMRWAYDWAVAQGIGLEFHLSAR